MAILPRPAFPPLPSLAPVLTALGLFGLGCPVGASGAGAALASPAATFQTNVRPLLKQYCYECHGNGKHKGDVALDRDQDVLAVHDHSKIWETVMERVHAEEMPPDDADLQPSQAERDAISGWIEHELFHLDPNNPDPGAVTIHRLNRAEYNNTVRDLVGVDFQPANDFPADNSGYGFDNISDVLSLSPVLLGEVPDGGAERPGPGDPHRAAQEPDRPPRGQSHGGRLQCRRRPRRRLDAARLPGGGRRLDDDQFCRGGLQRRGPGLCHPEGQVCLLEQAPLAGSGGAHLHARRHDRRHLEDQRAGSLGPRLHDADRRPGREAPAGLRQPSPAGRKERADPEERPPGSAAGRDDLGQVGRP